MHWVYNLFRLFAASVVLATAPATLLAAEPVPLSEYGDLPDIEQVALSNAGDRLAAVMRLGGGERVLVLLTSQIETIRMMKLDDAKVRELQWIGNDHVLMVLSRTEKLDPDFRQDQTEFWHAFILPADGKVDQWMVFDRDPKMLNAVFGIFGTRLVDGRWKAYFSGLERQRGARGYYIGNTGTSLYAVDVVDGKSEKIASSGSMGEGTGRLVGPDGTVAATLAVDIRTGFWTIKAPGGTVLATGTAPNAHIGLVALGRQGDSLIYSSRANPSAPTTWYEVPLDGSTGSRELAKAGEIDRIYIDRNTGRLIGMLRNGGSARPEFFDATRQKAVDEVYKAFPNSQISLADWTPDFGHLLIRTSGDGDSGTWFLVDMAKMHAHAIGYEREALGPEKVGKISLVAYKAQDGLDLDGVLTLPPGHPPQGLPLVMLPHGGPHAHDAPVFDWWAQAFASRGYAVFQPNFRGSTNRDEAFVEAGFGQWGKAMQTDISDAIAELARRGIVDPQRACIVGASYGGYAALAGVTLQEGIYRCAVAVAPVADVGMLFNSERYDNGRTGILRKSLEEEFGPRSGFDAISPAKQAAAADAPILLIHGKDDTVVPFEQSDRMCDALKGAGKACNLVVLRDEDHWLSRAATRQQMLEAAVAFVQKHNPAD